MKRLIKNQIASPNGSLLSSFQMKKKIYKILEKSGPEDKAGRFFDIFLICLIILNVISIILESIQTLSLQYGRFFKVFGVFSVVIFTVEYLGRIWTCTLNPKYEGTISGRIRFALSPLALVDLLAILPFYLPMLIHVDLRFIRALRLIRMFRVFKIGRYSESLKLFTRILKSKKEELHITAMVIFILLVVSSSLMYYVENRAQPKIFSNMLSTLWWGVTTLTTVGYGDIYPITPLGKFLGSIVCLLGVGLYALPTGILSAGFVEEIRKRRETAKTCPQCGAKFD